MVPAAELPTFLDSDDLRWILLAVIVVLVVAAVLVANFVRRMVTRVVLLGALALVAVLLWSQRAELGDCQETCACRVFGQDVHVPESAQAACAG